MTDQPLAAPSTSTPMARRVAALGAALACALTGTVVATAGPTLGLGRTGTTRVADGEQYPINGTGKCGHCWHPSRWQAGSIAGSDSAAAHSVRH